MIFSKSYEYSWYCAHSYVAIVRPDHFILTPIPALLYLAFLSRIWLSRPPPASAESPSISSRHLRYLEAAPRP